MKYTAILIALYGLFWIWRFISAAVERGLPTHPVYYISAVVGGIVGFLSYRLAKSGVTKRRYLLIPLLVLVINIAFGYTGIETLQYIGSGLFFWCTLSFLGFYGYCSIRKWGVNKESKDSSNNPVEAMSIGMVILIGLMVLVFGIVMIIVYILS